MFDSNDVQILDGGLIHHDDVGAVDKIRRICAQEEQRLLTIYETAVAEAGKE